MRKLLNVCVVVAATVVMVPEMAQAAETTTSTDSLLEASSSDVKRYWIGSGRVPAGIPNLAFVLQKGANLVPSGPQAVNYEQSFALNEVEASFARNQRWLALTCDGKEIHPTNIPSVTLLDPTNPAARAWRASEIASQTNDRGYDGTYLDTLRSYHPEGFYTGIPCGITDAQWLAASVDMVTLVKAQTDGKLVIANGAGLGSGRKYFSTNRAADPIIAAADAVQIEHFARGRYSDDDYRFIDLLTGQGKLAFAKCDSTPTTCTSVFSKAARPDMRFLHID